MFINKIKLLKNYRFEFKHLLVLLLVIIAFQIIVSFIHKTSLQNLLYNTQNWYQLDSAERLANLTATSLELLLETTVTHQAIEDSNKIIQAFNIILSQQTLEHDVEEISLIIEGNNDIHIFNDGSKLFAHYFGRNKIDQGVENLEKSEGLDLYKTYRNQLITNEKTISIPEEENTFHVLVPFVPKGEYSGAVYIRNKPDFTFITREIITSFDEITLIFVSLIVLGLLAMFYISSFTVKERDEAQKLLFNESQKFLREQIHHQKEMQFTKRIYHTHHKAEKVMGFIKEDLRSLSEVNIDEVKHRVAKYANFISRVIYDMKWYEPPVTSIRNPMFKTDLNQVITFIVNHIFSRVSDASEIYKFDLILDPDMPNVNVNEYVVWEILEPLIQNSIDHSGNQKQVVITIKTQYDKEKKAGKITLSDNGNGIPMNMLEVNSDGIKKIFLEHISSKSDNNNSGYGCYLAYEIAKQRCNWDIDAANLPSGGCLMSITISDMQG